MKKLLLSLLALTLLAAGPAMANDQAPAKPAHHRHHHQHHMCPPPGCHGMHKGPMGHPMMGFFERFDLNHDGKVTKDEFDKVNDRMFAKMDANKDGVITKPEMKRAWMEHMKNHRGEWKGREGWNRDGGREGWHARGGWGRPMNRLDYSHANDDNGQ